MVDSIGLLKFTACIWDGHNQGRLTCLYITVSKSEIVKVQNFRIPKSELSVQKESIQQKAEIKLTSWSSKYPQESRHHQRTSQTCPPLAHQLGHGMGRDIHVQAPARREYAPSGQRQAFAQEGQQLHGIIIRRQTDRCTGVRHVPSASAFLNFLPRGCRSCWGRDLTNCRVC